MKTKPLVMVGCYALLSFTFVGTAAAADTRIEQALGEIIAKSNKPKTFSTYNLNEITKQSVTYDK